VQKWFRQSYPDHFGAQSIVFLKQLVLNATPLSDALGVIEYRRGHITVLDRPKLEQLCCECYAVVKLETDRLLPRV